MNKISTKSLTGKIKDWILTYRYGPRKFFKDNKQEILEEMNRIVKMLGDVLVGLQNANVIDELRFLPSGVIRPQVETIWRQKIYILAGKHDYYLDDNDKNEIIQQMVSQTDNVIKKVVTDSGKWTIQS